MEKICTICGKENNSGLGFWGLRGDPFFCERCLFLILMKDKPYALADYCERLEPRDESRSVLAPVNIWKEY